MSRRRIQDLVVTNLLTTKEAMAPQVNKYRRDILFNE